MDDNDLGDQSALPSPLYYVGIGASAGGLEALETFFSQMPGDSGMAFIVIQHLSPDYKSMMVELLSKRTSMPVQRAEEGMLVEANSVYLIPPKKVLSIFHGKLLLGEMDHSKGINLPIDVFLRSLADDQAEKAIGIILSGTGSDGVRGIRALKEAGGMVLVQNEETAKFDGMPRSAISTGLADFVLPPEEMPQRLLSIARHPYASKPDHPQAILSDEDGLTRIFALLRERARVDFTYYKPSTVVRRIERRMTFNQTQDLREYVRFMESNPSEVMTLYRELLIGVTSFFRDRDVFEELENNHLPRLFEQADKREIRFWVAGCSTGEEAYTMAILSREVMEQLGNRVDVKIFATDIDRDAIQTASTGVYPESIAADLTPKLLTKYFHRKEEKFHVDRSIREMVVFAQHNLVKDPPFTNIDLVSCRNLLIYLQPVLQHKVMDLLSFSLNPQGILLLGTSETTGEMADLFEPLHQKFKIYQSKGKRRLANVGEFPITLEQRPWQVRARLAGGGQMLRAHEEERMLDRFLQSLAVDYVPLALVVNEQMEVLHILGNPEGYFRLPSGKLTNDISKMAVKDLSIPLATGLQKVFKTGEELKYTNIRLQGRDEPKVIQMRIRLLPGKKGQELLAGIFIEEATPQIKEQTIGRVQIYDVNQEAEQRIHDLEQELQFTRENLQATIEELETSNEELQATNEELLASNEELQSTNEELQSVNEELHTVNTEYQSKIMELTELNNDLDNLMSSTEIGVLFLDENLDIRRFTPQVKQIFKILDGDVGRPVSHLTHMLVDVDPFEIIREVERSSEIYELEVCTMDGIWFLMRVLPYHVGISSVSGLVITFININMLKQARDALLTSETRLSSLYRAAPVGIGLLINRTFVEVNDHFCEILGYRREELIGQSTRILYITEEDYEEAGKTLYRDLSSNKVNALEVTWKRKDGSLVPALLSLSLLNPEDESEGITFTLLDLSSYKLAIDEAEASEARYRMLYETMAEGVVYQNAQGEIISANPAAERILGLKRDEMTGRTSFDPRWQALKEDGSEYPGDQHPSILALKTGQAVMREVMGIYNPKQSEIRWIRINAIPLFKPGQTKPYQVYATFNDITDVINFRREMLQIQKSQQKREYFLCATIDAISDHIAVLDNKGVIIQINKAWRDFALENAGTLLGLGEGVNYLAVCENARGQYAANAQAFASGIRSVLKGEADTFELKYPCNSPQAKRWFIGKVTRFEDERDTFIVIAHEKIRKK